jgi:hypothetical protein
MPLHLCEQYTNLYKISTSIGCAVKVHYSVKVNQSTANIPIISKFPFVDLQCSVEKIKMQRKPFTEYVCPTQERNAVAELWF